MTFASPDQALGIGWSQFAMLAEESTIRPQVDNGVVEGPGGTAAFAFIDAHDDGAPGLGRRGA